MDKETKIQEIKNQLKEIGEQVTVYELDLQLPCINSIGDTIIQTIESFNETDIETAVYVDDMEHSTINISYNDLDDESLELIRISLEEYILNNL